MRHACSTCDRFICIRSCFVLTVISLLAGSPRISAADVAAQRLDGTTLTGQLLSIGPDRVTFHASGTEHVLRFSELLQLAWQDRAPAAPATANVWVQLADGSQLQGAQYGDSAGTATVKLLGGEQLQMPTRSVHSVRLHPPSELHDPQWQKIVSRDAKLDVLVVRRPGASLDYVEGALGGVTDSAVRFTLDGEAMDVPLDRLEGWVYYAPRIQPPPTPVCRIRDTHGNLWNAAQLELSHTALEIQTVAGVRHALPVEQLVNMDFASGNMVYLSDLAPLKHQWTPLLSSPALSDALAKLFQTRRDRSLGGRKLRLRSSQQAQRAQEFEKGLAIHSRSELVYRLPEGFRRLTAWAGMDEGTDPSGRVRLIIAGDGRTLWDRVLGGQDEPVAIDLDVAGVERLSILVDFTEDVAAAGQLDLCDIRITK